MSESYIPGKDKRTPFYTFTDKKSLIDYYLDFMPENELTELINTIESEPFIERSESKDETEMQKLKRLEWRINKHLRERKD